MYVVDSFLWRISLESLQIFDEFTNGDFVTKVGATSQRHPGGDTNNFYVWISVLFLLVGFWLLLSNIATLQEPSNNVSVC